METVKSDEAARPKVEDKEPKKNNDKAVPVYDYFRIP